jgi:deoxyribonuclease IV
MAQIKLGPAGTDGDSIKGLKHVSELGLDCCEIEFVRGVYMSNEKAKEVGKLAKELKIDLSIHAPYYINLISEEQEKIEASKKRILDSCERGYYLNAKYVVFHAAYYGKFSKEEAYPLVKKEIIEMQEIIKKKNWQVILAPETTGKKSQFGDLDELLKLAKETSCSLCVDFAHIYARNNGKIDYNEVFTKLKNSGLKHIHCHFSGIEYSEKGERKHIIMTEEFIMPLLKTALKYNIDLTIISESPITWVDSLKMRDILKKLK